MSSPTRPPRAASGAPIEHRRSTATAAAGLPFSDAVRIGDVLFVSGQMGIPPGKMQLVPGGIAAEARQALQNMRQVLEASGSSLDHVLKCTVFLADMAEWAAFNEVYVAYFGEHLPARSALGASGLALGGRVEIECVAAVAALE